MPGTYISLAGMEREMLNTVYRLVAPRRFEVCFNNIDLSSGQAVVRPARLSICHADQRYYQGLRPAEVLGQKLPMALIHEGTGYVVYDPSGTFPYGTEVVMVPNTPVEYDSVIAENYLRSSRFRASGYDGFMQENVALALDRLVPLAPSTDKAVAAFTELVSVSVHAMRRFGRAAHSRRRVTGIWGDGNLGYITALVSKAMFPGIKLYIFGTDREKLSRFSFAEETFLVADIPEDISVDHAFECVGGSASQKAVNQIIGCIEPEGTISLLGVSEYPVPVNTRMVLEKGLHIQGSSRSGREDFLETIALYKKYPWLARYLGNIVGTEIEVHTTEDIVKAFETDIQMGMGKTIMVWDK